MSDNASRKKADERAAKELLDEYEVKEMETDTTRVYQYTPKARVRGGGFAITVGKKTGEVTSVEKYQ